MSALAEALLAAQRQAINAMMKAHTQVLDGEPNEQAFYASLDAIGCGDKADSIHLWAALNIIRQAGAQSPGVTNGKAPEKDAATEPASEAQLRYIADLANERGVLAPDGPLTKAQASKVIEQLKAGSYVADEWTAPF